MGRGFKNEWKNRRLLVKLETSVHLSLVLIKSVSEQSAKAQKDQTRLKKTNQRNDMYTGQERNIL